MSTKAPRGPIRRDSFGHRKSDANHARTNEEKEKDAEIQASKFIRLFRSRRIALLVGSVIGIIIAMGLTQHPAVQSAASELPDLSKITDMSIDWIMNQNIIPSAIRSEAQNAALPRDKLTESFAVGLALKQEGYESNLPVILVPGVISTSLESWGLNGTAECPSKKYYRRRLWGSWYMIRAMLVDQACWIQHIMLDKETGLDPPNFKMRAAQGLEAADFFVSGYWIWNKIIENLSAMGYDTNNLYLAAYDWRLGFHDLEVRDRYFTKLMRMIEYNKKCTGKKSVLMGHSMGSQVIFFFLKWAEARGYGDGGPRWVNDHIDSFVDISGSMLGTPKALTSLLSGEMRDTVQLNALAIYGLEKFFGRHERAELLQTFPGISSMLPKGGNRLWGNMDHAPDDPTNKTEMGHTLGNFIRFTETKSSHSSRNLTVEDAIEYLYDHTPDWYVRKSKATYSHGIALTRKEVAANEKDPRKWSNPLEAALPYAPDLKIYCFYGVGKDTERSYTYHDVVNDKSTPLKVAIDYEHPNSVVLAQGDGTVSLLTHVMCHRWKDPNSKFNPGGAQVKVVEMMHRPEIFDIRGGAQTAEHVDILGRMELNELVGRVAAGAGDEIKERIESNIESWVYDIDLGE